MSSRQAASHLPPALPLWSLQGLGSLDLVTPVLKVTHSFHHSVMERMKEKVSKVKINCKAPIWEANPWSIPVLPKQKLVWTTKWPPANGMAPVHAFSHSYNEVFTVCIFPTSFHTATTQVWIYKDVLWGALKKKSSPGIHSQCASLQVQTKWKAYSARLTSLLYPLLSWDGLSIHFPPSENRKEMSTDLRNTVKQSTLLSYLLMQH